MDRGGAFHSVGYASSYEPVACTEPHTTETVHVGTLTDANAAGTIPPVPGSAATRPVRAECEQRADEFLGAPWRHGRVELSVVLPAEQAWADGARWYRCDLSLAAVQADDELFNRECAKLVAAFVRVPNDDDLSTGPAGSPTIRAPTSGKPANAVFNV